MSGNLSVTIDDEATRAGFQRAPAVVGAALHRTVSLGSVDFEGGVVAHTPVGATGQLRQSMTHQVSGSGMFVEGRVFSTDVPIKVASVETGRAPGKMPPSGPIEMWAARKLGITDLGIVFLIRRAIGRRGTKGAHMFQKGFQQELPRVQARVNDLMRVIKSVL